LLVLLFGFSCKKLISVPSPPTQLTPDKVFDNSSSAIAATANLYTVLHTVDGNFIQQVGTYTDELVTTNVDETSAEFAKSALLATNTSVLSVWQNLYKTIYKANTVIEGLQSSSILPDSVKSQCLGEALFMRAYCYFILTNIYGDVPLITSTSVTLNASASRVSSNLVEQQVITDLKNAATLLPTTYTGSGEKVRANKWAATALLSKAYLYTGDFRNSEAAASAIINSGQYALTDLSNVFLANSNEAILQLWNTNGYTTINSVPSSGEPIYQIAPSLLNAFEAGDQRLNNWASSTTMSGTTYHYPYKYKQYSPTTGSSAEYTMYLRLGEIYLIRAEARAHQSGEFTLAASDLNIIRSRAGLGNTNAVIQTDLLSAIFHERQVELFNENGNRLFDLRRSGTINSVLSALKPSWKSTGNVFPIPQSEVLQDPHLTENPGYTY